MNEYEKTFKEIKNGDVVEGTVIQVNDDGAVLNIGYKVDAFVPKNELSYDEEKLPSDVVKVGDKFEVKILKLENEDGNILASKKRVDFSKFWQELKNDYKDQNVVKGKIYNAVKGGVLANVKGFSCFIPASHLDLKHVDNLIDYIGKTIDLKIIEIDEQKKRIVGSRRNYLKDIIEKKKAETLKNLQAGQVVKGVVKSLTEYGAFVDIGGIDGLLRINEISWGRIKHPSDVLNIGDELEVYILNIDRETEKIGLSLKKIIPNPWESADKKYHVGDIKRGKVVGITQFGVFVELEPGIDGLIHKTYLNKRSNLKEGDIIDVEVLDVDLDKKRIRLKIK